MRSNTVNGPIIPIKQGNKFRQNKGRMKVKVNDFKQRAPQPSSPDRRRNSRSPTTNKVSAIAKKESNTIPEAVLKLGISF